MTDMRNTSKILFVALLAVAVASCKKPDYSISISTDIKEESIVITKKTPVTINYSIASPTGVLEVKVESSSNIVTRHFSDDGMLSGIVTASLLESGNDSFVKISANNGVNQAEYTLKLEMETIDSDGRTDINVEAAGGNVPLKIRSNVDYEIVIPEEAAGWISVVDGTKTMTPYTINLKVEANEDVKRSAIVTVRSKTAAEVKTDFTLTQAGVLKNLVITVGKSTAYAPNLLGNNLVGKIYWGDTYSVDWMKGAEHVYSDGIKDHIMEIHTNATGFEFSKMIGVTKISIKDF